MVNNIFLALGSNKGNRLEFIYSAVRKINENDSCKVLKCSSIYETTPYGIVDQPNFLNAVIAISSDFNIIELLQFVKHLEKNIGRTESLEKWGEREIDVDIIFYNDVIYTGDMLVIPHPESLKRDFVIIPLLEIAPDFIFPGMQKKIMELDLSSIENHIIRKSDFAINI
ncbi:MAG: 2-amino-4-hydroxy-6-hydroxymethyldihydropteridine diphosphokinase [Ignavibacteriales bacterium]|nr:2-amino-4-hydroxy-6-hydroxymethyldihydropteridine diphosphokinase [Ignavibacteriales bacterium]